jgi:hypothetical protein
MSSTLCKHNDVVFLGVHSLVGRYVCNDCKAEIDPVEYARLKGDLNFALMGYYEEFPERLNPIWHDHPAVAHLYS